MERRKENHLIGSRRRLRSARWTQSQVAVAAVAAAGPASLLWSCRSPWPPSRRPSPLPSWPAHGRITSSPHPSRRRNASSGMPAFTAAAGHVPERGTFLVSSSGSGQKTPAGGRSRDPELPPQTGLLRGPRNPGSPATNRSPVRICGPSRERRRSYCVAPESYFQCAGGPRATPPRGVARGEHIHLEFGTITLPTSAMIAAIEALIPGVSRLFDRSWTEQSFGP